MCDLQTQVLNETQSDNLIHENDDSLIWGRLFPLNSAFKQIGINRKFITIILVVEKSY